MYLSTHSLVVPVVQLLPGFGSHWSFLIQTWSSRENRAVRRQLNAASLSAQGGYLPCTLAPHHQQRGIERRSSCWDFKRAVETFH